MKQTLKIIFVSALATAALIKGVPALAEPTDTSVTVVRTADLDLASAAGQRQLDRRLVIAAHALCDGNSASDLKALNAEGDCRQNVIASGRSQARQILAGNGNSAIQLAANQ